MGTHLLCIVGVDFDERVRCQAPSCKRTVYSRIHVVNDNGKFFVLGSDCYKRLYHGIDNHNDTEKYGAGGRLLSKEERDLLIRNTEQFIDNIENEFNEKYRFSTIRTIESPDAFHVFPSSPAIATPSPPVFPPPRDSSIQQISFEGAAGLHWMWVRDNDLHIDACRQYLISDKREQSTVLVLRYFLAGTNMDPWGFANNVARVSGQKVPFILKQLYEFHLIELLPAYR